MAGYVNLVRNCAFCLLVVTLLVHALAAQDKIRVGVPEQFMSVAKKALQDTGLVNGIELISIKGGDNDPSLINLNETYSNVKSLYLDAVVGPFSIPLDLVAESLDFPYYCTSFDLSLVKKKTTFKMLPDTALAGQALLDIMKAYGWTEISLLYDDFRGASMVEQLVTSHSVHIQAWRLPIQAKQDQAKSALIRIRATRIKNFLIVCNKENTRLLLDLASHLALLFSPPYHWMFYDPGLESLEKLTMYTHIQINFTVVSLLNFNDTMKSRRPSKLEFALTSDAFNVILASKVGHTGNLTFDNQERRKNMTQILTTVTGDKTFPVGHTGNLTFDNQGRRKNVTLILTAVTGDKTFPRGMWYSNPPGSAPNMNLNTAVLPFNKSRPFPLTGKKVKVVIIENKPFTMLKKDHETRKGNDKFEGYCIDLIETIAKGLDFEYELYLVEDGKFGSKLENGNWNGIVGELIAGNASMSVSSLTITAERSTAVDFTKPFMNRQISALMRIPTYESSYFQFLSPLSPVVWMITMVAFAIVSCILYVLEKIGRSLGEKPTSDVPEITLRETIWFSFGSLVRGNTEPVTTSIPGRIMTSFWWFFSLILISSYTANLAAFITVTKMATPIKTVTDLSKQTKIKYGSVKDSAVETFFKNTHINYFSKMWAQMSEVEPDSMVDSVEIAREKVKKGDYAFFWDSTVIEYLAQEDCDLSEIGPPFDPKGLGIAVPPGASYLDHLSMEILRMSDTGILENIHSRWWDESKCPSQSNEADETSSLKIKNVLGIFLIVVGGIALASLVCLVKYFFPGLFRKKEKSLLKAKPQAKS